MALIDSLTAFEKGMREAASIISKKDPDYIIAPMMGSVPFIDSMKIVDENFDQEKVHYMPASSTIRDVSDIMKEWMSNFLDDKVCLEDPIKIMGIDEVVSGNSATRVYRAITSAINQKKKRIVGKILSGFDIYNPIKFKEAADNFNGITDFRYHSFIDELLREQKTGSFQPGSTKLKEVRDKLLEKIKAHVEALIDYHGIGIEDSKKKNNRTKQYDDIKKEGGIIPVSVEAIVTMDKPDLCPARYKRIKESHGYLMNTPLVEDFVVTPNYVAFLSNLATISGKSCDQVNPVNFKRILESSNYLNEETKAYYNSK